MPFAIAAAYDRDRGMARGGTIPWDLPIVRQRFHFLTTGQPDQPQNIVVMGRRTWESLEERERPLAGRLNVVLTRNDASPLPRGVLRAASLTDAVHRVAALGHLGRIMLIGGASACRDAVLHPECRELLITEIGARYGCDSFFPPIPSFFREAERTDWLIDGEVPVRFVRYEKRGV